MDKRTRRSLTTLINALRSAKHQHKLEDIAEVLNELSELSDVRVFAMMFPADMEPPDFTN